MTTWHVITSVPQRERILAAELHRGLGLYSYVPVEVRKISRNGRALEIKRPLMPGYVFAGAIDGMPWRDIRDQRDVRGWLTVNGDIPASVSDLEVQAIRQLESLHNKQITEARQFRVGDRVRFNGPFGSIESLLSSVRGSNAKMEVKMLGSTRTVSVPLQSLERV